VSLEQFHRAYNSSGGREREAHYNVALYYEGILLAEVFSTLILCLPSGHYVYPQIPITLMVVVHELAGG
jgi:hypothetical protein